MRAGMIYCEANPYSNPDDPSVHRVFRNRKHVHLCADSTQELMEYAISIGMKPGWIQHVGSWKEHYDAVGKFRDKALADPRVTKLTKLELVNYWRKKRGVPPLTAAQPSPTALEQLPLELILDQ